MSPDPAPSEAPFARGWEVGQRGLWSQCTRFAPLNVSVFEARAFLRHHLMAHDLADLVGRVQAVGGELATQAALDSRIPFTLLLERFDFTVRVTVRDDSLMRSVLAVAPPMTLRGRGQRIVEAHSRDWGITGGSTSAKAIWASFDVP